MKKIIACMLIALLLCTAALPVAAAEPEPYITSNPTSADYPEGAVAMYTCNAFGNNLTFDWYLVFEGTTYRIADADGSQPWCAYTINTGITSTDSSSTCFFEGIMPGLAGAELYCVIEDGHYSVQSTSAILSVSAAAMPPQVSVVGSMEVYQGDPCDLYCSAWSDNSSETFSYLWYQTGTGRLQDITAVDRGSQTTDTLHIDTSAPGLSYYVCLVTASGGGSAYSAIIPVRIMERPQPPTLITKTLPEATLDEGYYTKLEFTGKDTQLYEYYAPEHHDKLDEIGLFLNADGEIFGTPTKAGTFEFIICISNVAGEVSRTYTLKVTDPKAQTASSTASSTPADPDESAGEAPSSSHKPTLKPAGTGTTSSTPTATDPSESNLQQPESGTAATDTVTTGATTGLPWWSVLLIAIGAAGAGVGAVLLINRKNK